MKNKTGFESMNQIKSDWLNILLDLKRTPVGIYFIFDEEEYNLCNTYEPKNSIAYCTVVKNASEGKSFKLKSQHFACAAAARALGIIENSNENLSGMRHFKMGVYEDLGTGRSIAKDMVFCQHKIFGIEVKPLSEFCNYNPNVVILVENPYNAMRIVQGYAYSSGHLKNIKMVGMNGICQECTSYPFESNQLNLSMLCSGTRCVAQWRKDELGIGTPYRLVDEIIYGLKKTLNHMENNSDKKKIEAKLKKFQKEEELEIVYDENYYKGAFKNLMKNAIE